MVIAGGEALSHDFEPIHEPVLVAPLLSLLGREQDPDHLEGWVVDGTLGAAGHTCAILEAFPRVRVFAIDPDPEVLAVAREALAAYNDRVHVQRGRISQLARLVAEAKIGPIVGVLFDVGVNSLHLDRAERGFSFQKDGPLDMRMDPDLDRTAADIVNRWDEDDLADLIYYEGGESRSRKIAKAICQSRRRVPFLRTYALAELIASTVGKRADARIHPATKTFQALRRAVNEEGEELMKGLEFARDALAHGGRLCAISFHSGEDGVVKRTLQAQAKEGLWRVLTKKPIEADPIERRENPRARSARLRVAERLRQDPEGAR